MTRIFALHFVFLLALPAFPQVGGHLVEGNVKDAKNTPLEFVNVLLLKASDSSLVKASVTDEKGDFVFENVADGEYRLKFSQAGFSDSMTERFSAASQKHFDLILKDDPKVLDEVEVNAQRPLIEHKPGKTIVNVENSIIGSGGTVYDVLKRSPGVIIDNNGNITFKGKSGVLVMIDGKLTYLSGEQLTNLLKSMPADQAYQVELMSKPPSKYDASGNSGIINIKLKKSKYLGFNGTTFTTYSQGFYAKENVGLNLNYRTEKVNVFGNGFFAHRKSFERLDIVRKFRDSTGDLSSIFTQYSRMQSEADAFTFKGGMDYFISKKQTLGLQVNGNNSSHNSRHTFNSTSITNGDNEPLSSADTRSALQQAPSNLALNLNYKLDLDTLGGFFTADLDYARFGFGSDLQTSTNSYDSAGASLGLPYQLHSIVPLSVDIRSGKFDLSKPMGKTIKFECGAKSSLVTTDNDVRYFNVNNGVETIDSTKTNHFTYSENINALYADISKEWKKFSFELGLRGEQTLAKGHQVINDSDFTKNYFKLFPTMFLSYKINKKNQLDLSVNRRIDRPDYNDLNPFKDFLDPYTYMEGNPFLKPQFTNSAELSYTFMEAFSATVTYSRTTDIIMEVVKQVDSTRTSYATKDNLDVFENYDLELEIPVPITKWWVSENYFSLMYNAYKGNFQGAELNKSSTSWIFNSQNEFNFKKGWSGEMSFEYVSPMVYGISRIARQYDLTIGIQKKFYHDRFKIKVSCEDLIHNPGDIITVNYQNMDIYVKSRDEYRITRLTFIWNFGKTTVKYSRQHHSGAQDELDRVKMGGKK
ncbi:MAG TPA: outer membrane beta-barrel family protein [Bacteroidia bacterium]|jgi:hypothetical protein